MAKRIRDIRATSQVLLYAVFMRQDKTFVRATDILFVLLLAFKKSSLFTSSMDCSAQLSDFEL